MIELTLVILVIFFLLPFALCLCDKLFTTSYSCKIFSWHNGKGTRSFDGCSVHSTCSKCGAEVMQDGQGNWFRG